MSGQGAKELRQLRLKAETSRGVKVFPRFVWRGVVEGIDDQRDIQIVEENVGHFGGTDRSYTGKLYAELAIPDTPATFQQLPDLLMMCGMGTSGGGNWAGSAQGASGSSVSFILPIPDTAQPTSYPTYTAEVGNNAWAEVMEYTLCKKLDLKATGGEAVMVSATLFGRQGTAGSATGVFSIAGDGTLPLAETILASKGSFWLTPTSFGSTFGTSQVTAGNILALNLSITPKWTTKYPVDSGQLYFHTVVYTGCDIEGEVVFEAQISGTFGVWGSAGQKERWRSELASLLQASWFGGAISEGTTYLNSELTLQLPFKWTKFDVIGDQDGNETVAGKFVSKFDPSNIAAIGRGTVRVVRLGTSEFAGA